MDSEAPPRRPRVGRLALAWLAVLLSVAVAAVGLSDNTVVPHLDGNGQAAFRQFLAASPPKAFAIAAGGAWGWAAAAPSPEGATEQALEACQAQTRQTCLVYARNDRLVLDAKQWSQSWGPYLAAAQARRAPLGNQRGQRFPDLAFFDAHGKPLRLADLRGKVVVLHFWGSWCPPCQREMPDLARLMAEFRRHRDVRFVLLQVREDFKSARTWAQQRVGKDAALHDSGATGSGDTSLRLGNGKRVPDRDIAAVFPTTYVLDRHGIVVFAHAGPLSEWSQYAPFLRDAAARSGR